MTPPRRRGCTAVVPLNCRVVRRWSGQVSGEDNIFEGGEISRVKGMIDPKVSGQWSVPFAGEGAGAT